MGKFLSIYTPTYERPVLLARCVESVEEQTIRDEIQHLIVQDEVGVGIPGMFAEIPAHLDELEGDYIYILQDDDVLVQTHVVEGLKRFIRAGGDPEVVIVKVRKRSQILPTFWGERPRKAHIDLGNYVVRRDVFVQHVADFGRRYEGDYDFIDALWKAGHRFAWCDLLFAHAMTVGQGRPQSEIDEAVIEPPERAVGRRVRKPPRKRG